MQRYIAICVDPILARHHRGASGCTCGRDWPCHIRAAVTRRAVELGAVGWAGPTMMLPVIVPMLARTLTHFPGSCSGPQVATPLEGPGRWGTASVQDLPPSACWGSPR